jgi:hypothetical protein
MNVSSNRHASTVVRLADFKKALKNKVLTALSRPGEESPDRKVR